MGFKGWIVLGKGAVASSCPRVQQSSPVSAAAGNGRGLGSRCPRVTEVTEGAASAAAGLGLISADSGQRFSFQESPEPPQLATVQGGAVSRVPAVPRIPPRTETSYEL